MHPACAALTALSALIATPCHALCIYNGVDNAKTTIAQEFRDSRWVVRARVIGVDDHRVSSGEGWSLYHLRVQQQYKGARLRYFDFFTFRDSGGFYMDKGAQPDIDGDYLLFLVPEPWPHAKPRVRKNALWVNYNCGQSKSWDEVKPTERAEVQRLAQHR